MKASVTQSFRQNVGRDRKCEGHAGGSRLSRLAEVVRPKAFCQGGNSKLQVATMAGEKSRRLLVNQNKLRCVASEILLSFESRASVSSRIGSTAGRHPASVERARLSNLPSGWPKNEVDGSSCIRVIVSDPARGRAETGKHRPIDDRNQELCCRAIRFCRLAVATLAIPSDVIARFSFRRRLRTSIRGCFFKLSYRKLSNVFTGGDFSHPHFP